MVVLEGTAAFFNAGAVEGGFCDSVTEKLSSIFRHPQAENIYLQLVVLLLGYRYQNAYLRHLRLNNDFNRYLYLA